MARAKGFCKSPDSPVVFLILVFLFNILVLMKADTAPAATKMLMINPVRIIFTDRQRTVTVSVSNPSTQAITYAISLVTARKDAKGKYFQPEVETREEALARSLVRYSPRRATIEPGKRQLIKLMVRKPKDLPVGEYQTRLELRPIEGPQTAATTAGIADSRSSINLDVIVVSTFPVIIQHGDIYGDIMPKSAKLVSFPTSPSGLAVDISFSRDGRGSGFGNVTLFHSSQRGGRKPISGVQGLAMYIPETRHALTIPLKNITREELSSGTIEVVYTPTTGFLGEQLPRRLTSHTTTFSLPLR